jgi:hypothetical protein
MKFLRAQNESELGSILDYVHDRKYDIDRILLDETRQELRIPVYLGSRQCEATLLIRGASKFELTDEARIGEGDINTIRRKGSRVEIDGGFPVKISIEVDRLDIELSFPDNAPPA